MLEPRTEREVFGVTNIGNPTIVSLVMVAGGPLAIEIS
jgi:hypothetical protein